MIASTTIPASQIPLEDKMDWFTGDTFRILGSGKEIVATSTDTHHIYYLDGEASNSIRIDLVERIVRRKKAVVVPSHIPQGRTPKERYQWKEMLSTDFRYFKYDAYWHYGPYVVLWETTWEGAYLNLSSEERAHGVSPYLPQEYVISRHDEDENEFDVLCRTSDKDEAHTFFRTLEEEYPQGIVPHGRKQAPHSHGGFRAGAGRKNELGETKGVLLELPTDFVEALDAEVASESQREGRKVSRAEIVRRRLGLPR